MGKGPQKQGSSQITDKVRPSAPGSPVRIAHITDVHISAFGRRTAVLKDRAAEILADVLEQINYSKADVTIFGGDNIDNREDGQADLELFFETVRQTQNWRCILGNHEAKNRSKQSPGMLTQEDFLEAVKGHGIRPGQTSFSEAFGQVRIIAINTTIMGHHGGLVDGPTLKFLETELANASEKHIVVFGHHLLAETWAPAQFETWDQEYLVQNRDMVCAVLASNSNVRAYLCGHHHASHIGFIPAEQAENGFYQILTPSLSAFPHGARILTFTEDSLVVETIEPRIEGLMEEGLTAVLGGRKIQRFKTLNHPRSFIEYLGGRESDRNVRLPLNLSSSAQSNLPNSSVVLV